MLSFIRKIFKQSPDFNRLVKEGAIIIDVRTKGEFQAGHIDGSENIPLSDIKVQVHQLKKLGNVVILVCRSGNRSAIAKSILLTAGIEVYNGGAWTTLKRKIGAINDK
jgi:phage shock protein E